MDYNKESKDLEERLKKLKEDYADFSSSIEKVYNKVLAYSNKYNISLEETLKLQKESLNSIEKRVSLEKKHISNLKKIEISNEEIEKSQKIFKDTLVEVDKNIKKYYGNHRRLNKENIEEVQKYLGKKKLEISLAKESLNISQSTLEGIKSFKSIQKDYYANLKNKELGRAKNLNTLIGFLEKQVDVEEVLLKIRNDYFNITEDEAIIFKKSLIDQSDLLEKINSEKEKANSIDKKSYENLLKTYKEQENVLKGLMSVGKIYPDLLNKAKDTVDEFKADLSRDPIGLGLDFSFNLSSKADMVFEKVKKELENSSKIFVDKLKEGHSPIKSFALSFKDLGKSVGELALKWFLILKALSIAKNLFLEINKETKAISTETGLSFDQSYKIYKQALVSQTVYSNQLSTLEDILSVQKSIINSYGREVKLSDRVLVNISDTAKSLGYSSEEAGQLLSTFMNLGASEKFASNLIVVTGQLAKAKKLSPGIITKDIVSNAKFLSIYFSGAAKQAAILAVRSRELGLSLSHVDAIMSSLLDYETSVTSEFEASAALNKRINLSLARQYLYEGKISDALEEVVKQAGTLYDWQNMHWAQRKLLAKAAGVEVQDLEKALIIRNLSVGLTKKEQDLLAKRQSEFNITSETTKEMLRTQISSMQVSDKYKAQLEKIGNSLKIMVLPLLEALVPILDTAVGLLKLITPILKVIAAAFRVIGGILKYITESISSFFDLIDGAVDRVSSKFSFINDILKGTTNILGNVSANFEDIKPIVGGISVGLFGASTILKGFVPTIKGIGGFLKTLVLSPIRMIKKVGSGALGKISSIPIGGAVSKGGDVVSKSLEKVSKKDIGSKLPKANIKASGFPLDSLAESVTKVVKVITQNLEILSKSIKNILSNIGSGVGLVIENVFKGIGKGLSFLGDPKALKGAATLLVLSGSILAISVALSLFQKMDPKQIAAGALAIGGLAVVFAGIAYALGAASVVMGPGIVLLLGLGAAALLFGAAILMAGKGSILFSSGLSKIGEALKDFDVAKLVTIGPALLAMSAGLAAVSLSGGLNKLTSLFSGDIFKKIGKLADQSDKLSLVKDSMLGIAEAVSVLSDRLEKVDFSKIKEIPKNFELNNRFSSINEEGKEKSTLLIDDKEKYVSMVLDKIDQLILKLEDINKKPTYAIIGEGMLDNYLSKSGYRVIKNKFTN